MIDRESDRPAYKQLADALRDRIVSGALPPGARLPSETTLGQETGLSRNTIRQAVRLLRDEGLVVVEAPHGTRVRDRGEAQVVTLGPGDQVEYRGATVVVTRTDGETDTYPAAEVTIRVEP